MALPSGTGMFVNRDINFRNNAEFRIRNVEFEMRNFECGMRNKMNEIFVLPSSS